VGKAIATVTPTNKGGAASTWTITPGLSAGLDFDGSTGQITGTPTAPGFPTQYKVKATNASGSDSATLNITVKEIHPVISYQPAAYAFTIGKAIPAVLPTSSGGKALLWAIYPNLPKGLALNMLNGQITGTPAILSPSNAYIVEAINLAGTARATLTISVVALPSTPVVTAPDYATAGATGLTASVPIQTGSTYAWTVTGGTVTAGGTTNQITFTAGATGTVQLGCVVSNAAGTPSAPGTATSTIVPRPVITSFTPSALSIGPGATVNLTAIFAAGPGGTASVDQGVGTVTSGVAASSPALAAPTNFTLTVTNAANTKVTASTRVIVGNLSVLAGTPNFQGTLDGPRATAMLGVPAGLALDGSGNLFLADSYNNGGTIRYVTTVGRVTTLAGTPGYLGSSNTAPASFDYPQGCALDSNGNLYVADMVNNLIRKRDASGVVTTYAGIPGVAGSTDTANGTATFYEPCGVAVDAAGNVYVADSGNNLIRIINTSQQVSTIAGTVGQAGATDGTALGVATFNFPVGIALDSSGNIYVSDAYGGDVRKISGGQVSTLATGLNYPMGLAVDSAINVYVAVSNDNTIAKIVTTPAVSVATFAGQSGIMGSTDGPVGTASFFGPTFVALDASGVLYVSDGGNATIREISGGMVSTISGHPGQPGTHDGTGSAAQFNQPWAIAQGPSGNFYIADTGNNSIRMMTPGGVVTTLAGSDTGAAGSGDGNGSVALFSTPISIAVDAAENVYVADYGNSTIRKIIPGTSQATTQVSTIVGQTGVRGWADGDGKTVALLRRPQGVACDTAGNIFIADTRNHVIRKMTPDGYVSTIAGVVGSLGSADGPALSATFDTPQGLVMGPTGVLYIIDVVASTIRTLSADGTTVSTWAGQPYVYGPSDGVGTAATFYTPNFAVFDPAGNLYVNDFGRIRRISPGRNVETIIGTPGMFANFAGPLPAVISPIGLALDPVAGNLYIMVPDGVLTSPY
jgi:sugar lactone lactonase YvrE